MVTEMPKVQPHSRYNVTQTCRLLGIHRNSLRKYSETGRIKFGVRKSTGRRFYQGNDIIKFWTSQI
ncbi:MAG: helix-turn-helix domain-containing protein [Muribaculaceae bacterium]|nr:helix-turn-helix domain-containing protein [Muribaculaceae bacterium]